MLGTWAKYTLVESCGFLGNGTILGLQIKIVEDLCSDLDEFHEIFNGWIRLSYLKKLFSIYFNLYFDNRTSQSSAAIQ